MKITELLEIDQTTTQAKIGINPDEIDISRMKNLVGLGSTAYVKNLAKNPQAVVRKPLRARAAYELPDPYDFWIEQVIDYNKQQKNPYLPKVLALRTRKGSDEFSRIETHLPKYQNGEDQDPTTLINLGRKIFPRFDQALKQSLEITRQNNPRYYQALTEKLDSLFIWNRLIFNIRMILEKGNDPNSLYFTNDKNLLAAIDLVKKTMKDYDTKFKAFAEPDISAGNIMFDSNQQNLVITDPIYVEK